MSDNSDDYTDPFDDAKQALQFLERGHKRLTRRGITPLYYVYEFDVDDGFLEPLDVDIGPYSTPTEMADAVADAPFVPTFLIVPKGHVGSETLPDDLYGRVNRALWRARQDLGLDEQDKGAVLPADTPKGRALRTLVSWD